MAKVKAFAVFGLGTFGFEVCRVLSEKGGKVIAIDVNPRLVEKAKDFSTQALHVDATDEESLKNVPLSDVDSAVVAIGDDLEASILTTAMLKNIGIPHIIARALSDIHAQVLRQVGATEILYIEIEEGRRLANRLISPDVLDRIPLSKNQTLAEVLLPPSLAGRTLARLDLRKKFSISVITIKRPQTSIDDMGNPVTDELVLQPDPAVVLEKEDVLVIIGKDESIDAFKEL